MTEKDLEAAEKEGLEKRFKMATTFNTSNMICFDLNGKIKKYASAEDILIDFYHKRLEYYGLRKVSMLSVKLTIATLSRRAQQAIRTIVQSSPICQDDHR